MADFGFGITSGLNTFSANINSATAGLNWKHFLIGALVALGIAMLIYLVIERADTRPVIDGFSNSSADTDSFGQVPKPYSTLGVKDPFIDHPAPAIPPEEKKKITEHFTANGTSIYSDYVGHVSKNSDVLLELQELEAKLGAFKHDISSPAKTINASKLVQYNTYQDIRPLADWTSQCFSKNVPERDILLQMERWFLSGKKTLADLNAAAGFAQDKNVERLGALIEDVKTVAVRECVSVAHTDVQGITGPHDPSPWGSAVSPTSAQYD